MQKRSLQSHLATMEKQKQSAIYSLQVRFGLLKKAQEEKIQKKLAIKEERAIQRKQKQRDIKIDRFTKNWERKEKWHAIVKYIERRPSIKKLWDKLLLAFQEYIRLLETDENGYGNCFTCWCKLHRNKPIGKKVANAWHWIPAKKKGSALYRNNVHLQCNWCNRNQYLSWDFSKYKEKVVSKYWPIAREAIEHLSQQKIVLGQWEYTRERIEQQTEHYQQENIFLRSQKIPE